MPYFSTSVNPRNGIVLAVPDRTAGSGDYAQSGPSIWAVSLDNIAQSAERYGVEQSSARGQPAADARTRLRPTMLPFMLPIMGMFRAALLPAASCALFAGSAVIAHAQSIVVRSTGPSAISHPKGQRLPRGAVVSLRNGDVITILDKVGTRVLRGPGTFRLDGVVVRDNGVAARLSRSLGDPASLRSTLRAGAVRGVGNTGTFSAALPETIWLADVDAGGNVCVPKFGRLFLWRRATAAGRSGSLATIDDRVKLNVQWPAQGWGTAWPIGAMPLVDGAAYRFTDQGPVSKTVEFKIVTLDPTALPTDAAGLGAVLLDKGCTVQFDWLASSLERQSP